MHPKKILHPTDYTEASRQALLEAADLAQTHGAGLVLLHVVETLGPEKLTHGEVAGGPQPEAYRRRLFEELHRVRPAAPDLHVEYVLSEEDVVTAILRTAADLGCDLIDVSTGQTVAGAEPVYGRMYQTPFSDQIRNDAGLATMCVGAITTADQVNTIIAAGRADLVALARPHLVEPYWTLHAAAAQDYRGVWVPPPYLGGQAQLARNLKRAAEMEAALRA